MIIGILQADSVREEFQPAHGDYPRMFEELLGTAAESTAAENTVADIEFRHYNVELGDYPADIDECDGYVITGSKKSVYDDEPWIHVLSDFVTKLHEQKKKTVGICFGHQLVAQALGGKTEPADVGWGVGIHHYRMLANEPYMDSQASGFGLIVSHKDQVTRLPEGAELLATSDFCPNAMFRMGEHILTFQGHPEFSKAYSKDLMEMRQDILAEKFQPGIDSLQNDPDGPMIGRWMIKFLVSDRVQ